MIIKTSDHGLYLIHHYESCCLEAYPDPATCGAPWTIGWGETSSDITCGMKITQNQADMLLVSRLAKEFEPGVLSACAGVNLLQSEFDALVCFAYNVGLGNLRSSTLLKMVCAGQKDAAANQFVRWDRAGGRQMLGLYRRRVSERALYLGESGASAYAVGQAVKKIPSSK